MGTRGLYGFRKNEQDKTTYNHFDSYPEYLGANILEFIKKHSIAEMNTFYDCIVMVNQNNIPTDEQKKNCKENNFIDLSVGSQSENDWYCLLRNVQGDLETLYKCKYPYMIDNRDFIKDSLFCEYAYIINLDTNVLEFYKGFQHVPQDGNRYGIEKTDGYYPCKLEAEIPIEQIQSAKDVNEIISKFMNEEEEE